MKKFALVTVFILVFSQLLPAQWTKTAGPVGGSSSHLIKVGSYTFVNGGPGGVFRTEDLGQNWIAVNNGLPAYPHCYALTSFGSKLYASISEAGIFYSNDFGQNWVAINNGIQGTTSYGLFVNGDDLYAANANGGYFIPVIMDPRGL